MKQERREEERQRQLNAKRRAARNKRILIGSLIAVAVLVVAAVSYAVYSNTHTMRQRRIRQHRLNKWLTLLIPLSMEFIVMHWSKLPIIFTHT